MQEKTVDFLMSINNYEGPAISISGQEARIIIDKFVPDYVELVSRRAYNPPDIVSHGIGSALFGSLGGHLIFSEVEKALFNLFQLYVHVEGAGFIGAGVCFAVPYVIGGYKALTSERNFRKERNRLFETVGSQLARVPAQNDLNVFANQRRKEIELKRAKRKKAKTNMTDS